IRATAGDNSSGINDASLNADLPQSLLCYNEHHSLAIGKGRRIEITPNTQFSQGSMPETLSQERAIVLAAWPQPAAVSEPNVDADDSSLTIQYRTADERIALVRFPLCTHFTFGAPNDEALGGHPLWNRGLQFYSVHEVTNSSLIQLLERRNSVHPRHDKESY